MNSKIEKIYIKLDDEGTTVWRPVEAYKNEDGTYTISSSESVPTDENWEFLPGQIVACKNHKFSSGELGLVAFETNQQS